MKKKNQLPQRGLNYYQDGGSININPKREGKFTDFAKSIGMDVQAAAAHVLAHKDKYSPMRVKQANFARNAAKFKHAEGGPVTDFGGYRFPLPPAQALQLTGMYDTSCPDCEGYMQYGGMSREGYRSNSPDRFNPYNIIPSGNISMQNVPHRVLGTDNLGNQQLMFPGYHYNFPGSAVMEKPFYQQGGSIVDYLNTLGQDASLTNRGHLASQFGIESYKGTAAQNLQLLKLLQSNKDDGSNQPQNVAPDQTAIKASPMTPGAPAPPQNIRPENGYVNLGDYGINLYNKDGSFSPDAIQFAQKVQAANPDTKVKFVCNEKGCFAIANRASQGETGKRLYGDAAWQNNGTSVWQAPALQQYDIGSGQPLANPKDYSVPDVIKTLPAGMFVGMNRKNNTVGGAATTMKDANDSYDYANDKLYPQSHGYEHIGYTLGNGQLLHGTAPGTTHPGYFVIDDLNDNEISLPGYGKYAPVEVLSTNPDAKPVRPLFAGPAVKQGDNVQYQLKDDNNDNAKQLEGKKQLVSYFNNKDVDNQLMKTTGMSYEDLQGLKPVAMGIFGNESSYNDPSMGRRIKEFFGNMGSNSSVGPFQIKLSTIPENVRSQFGIKSADDLKNMEKAYPAALAVLYNNLQKTDQAVAQGKQPALQNMNRYFRAAYDYNMPLITEGGDKRIEQLWKEKTQGGGGTAEEKQKFFEKMRLKGELGSYPYKAMENAYDLRPVVNTGSQEPNNKMALKQQVGTVQPSFTPAVLPSSPGFNFFNPVLNSFQVGGEAGRYMQGYMQTGGDTTYSPPQGYTPSSPQERTNWNQFLDYLQSKGVAGSKDLDARDKGLGLNYLNEYNKANPNAQVPESFIPRAQYESYLIRKQNTFPGLQPSEAQYAFNNLSTPFKQLPISAVDNWLGSYTSREYYPTFKRGISLQKADGTKQSESYDFGPDFQTYVQSLNNPDLGTPFRVNPTGTPSLKRLGGQHGQTKYKKNKNRFNNLYQQGGPYDTFSFDPTTAATYLAGQNPGFQNYMNQNAIASKTNSTPWGVNSPSNNAPSPVMDPSMAAIYMAGQNPNLTKFLQQKSILSKNNQNPSGVNDPAGTTPPDQYANPHQSQLPPQTKTYRTQNPALAGATVAGMSFFNNALESNNRNSYKDLMRMRGMSDSYAPVTPGSRGDYSFNEGYFRPNQYVPVQFGTTPTAQMGGIFDDPITNVPQLQPPVQAYQYAGMPGAQDQYAGMQAAPMPTGDQSNMAASTANMKNVKINNKALEAFNYYVDEKNLSPLSAASIVGNLWQESDLKPTAKEQGNTQAGRGIAQWDVNGRWQGFQNWAKKNNRNPNDLHTQLDYVLAEPGESAQVLKELGKAKTLEDAVYMFGKKYLRPLDKKNVPVAQNPARWDIRTNVAQQLYNTYQSANNTANNAADVAGTDINQQPADMSQMYDQPSYQQGGIYQNNFMPFPQTIPQMYPPTNSSSYQQSYQRGGEYMVTPSQLQFILAHGGEVEFL